MLACDRAADLQQMEVSVGLNHQEGTRSCCTATSEASQQLSVVVVSTGLDVGELIFLFTAMHSCQYTEDTPLHLETILMKGETERRSCQTHFSAWLLWGEQREHLEGIKEWGRAEIHCNSHSSQLCLAPLRNACVHTFNTSRHIEQMRSNNSSD